MSAGLVKRVLNYVVSNIKKKQQQTKRRRTKPEANV